MLQVGDVALDERNLGQLLLGQDQPQPARVLLEIVDPDLVAPGQQVADDPAADAAIAARQQDTHWILLWISALQQPLAA